MNIIFETLNDNTLSPLPIGTEIFVYDIPVRKHTVSKIGKDRDFIIWLFPTSELNNMKSAMESLKVDNIVFCTNKSYTELVACIGY